ncbi:MAG: PEP-CTERM sorting domain-containing protein [Microcystis sp. M04BS1]|nr:PEP-CTERM sorting domain-containing protein [Microcystis sp. M04BS1]
MITNISRQLTTGVLAIAGSVAAFGFGGIAQAQLTTANATFGGSSGGVTFTGNLSTATSITFDSLTGLVSSVPANYTPFGGSIAPNNFNSGPLGTTFASGAGFGVTFTGAGPANVLDFTGAGAGNSTEGITLNFASSNLSSGTSPTNRYTFTASSGIINSQSDSGVNISFLGSFADSGGSFSTSAATVTIAIASSGVGQGTNTFTFGTPPAFASTSVPEPSAILGILAVAGIGAFARRKS